MPSIAIIGGGPGGLFTAHRLQALADRPYRLTIFEATERLGGKVLTGHFTKVPVTYEVGAAELYDNTPVGEDPLRALVNELGLPVTAMAGHTVHSGARFVSTTEDVVDEYGPAARDAIARFDVVARGLMSPEQFYDSDQAESFPADDGQGAFADLFERVSDSGARRYLEQLIHSDLATEPHRTNLRYGLQNYLMNDPAYMELYSIDGGNENLIHEIARRLAAVIRKGEPVTAIEGLGRDGVRLTHGAGEDRVETDFDYVVVALPMLALHGMDFRGPDLAARMADHVAHFDHPAHYLRVSILFETPFWKGVLNDSFCMLEDFGGCCLYDESSRAPDAKYGVLGWLLGGDPAEEMATWSDERLVEAMLKSLPGPLAHGRDEVIEASVHRWLGSVNAMPGGTSIRSFDARHLPAPASAPHLLVVGDYLFDSTLNGVLESADFAARHIASEIA